VTTPLGLVIVGVIVVALIGLTLAVPLLGLILGAVFLVGLLVWFFFLAGSRRTPSELAQRVDEQQHLGPGGPDDPER
jgi:hypothetical protein